MSARRARRRLQDRADMGESAASVPGGEGSYKPGRPVELDAPRAGGFGPRKLASVPFDKSFGVRRDVEVFVETGVLLADLRVSVLDQQPVTLGALAAGEVEADD